MQRVHCFYSLLLLPKEDSLESPELLSSKESRLLAILLLLGHNILYAFGLPHFFTDKRDITEPYHTSIALLSLFDMGCNNIQEKNTYLAAQLDMIRAE